MFHVSPSGGIKVTNHYDLSNRFLLSSLVWRLPYPNRITSESLFLFFSCWQAFSKYVNKWVTIATPFQGDSNYLLSLGKKLIIREIASFTGTDFGFWLTGAPGCINDSLLTGVQFVEGLESFFFVSRWTMHQLVNRFLFRFYFFRIHQTLVLD